MRMDRIPAYELILREKISDIHSEGYLLKHKKKWCQSDGAEK